MQIKVNEIIEYLQKETKQVYEYNHKDNSGIQTYTPLRALKDNSLTWINENEEYDYANFEQYENLVIVSHEKNQNFLKDTRHPCFFSSDPRALFFDILEHFNPREHLGIYRSPTATIESDHIGQHVHIGHHTYSGKEVTIGDHCIIKNNVSIEGRVTIGDHCVIDSGVVVGMDGFGYIKDDNNNNKRVPHYGGIQIGHHVEIGGNTCIVKGCLDDTVIGNYVKIDNLCHIAHNVIIKDNAQIIVAGIGGSTTIGENTWVGFHSVVKEGLIIGDNCVIGAGACVTKNVPDGKVAAGVPAKIIRDTFDENGVFRR